MLGDSGLPVTRSFYANTMGNLSTPSPHKNLGSGACCQEQETGPDTLGQDPHSLLPEGGGLAEGLERARFFRARNQSQRSSLQMVGDAGVEARQIPKVSGKASAPAGR